MKKHKKYFRFYAVTGLVRFKSQFDRRKFDYKPFLRIIATKKTNPQEKLITEKVYEHKGIFSPNYFSGEITKLSYLKVEKIKLSTMGLRRKGKKFIKTRV